MTEREPKTSARGVYDTPNQQTMSESIQSPAGSAFDQALARIAVGAYDDAQEVRKSMMNRVRDVVRKRNEGIPFDEVEDEKDDKSYDSKYKDENLPEIVRQMRAEDKLTEDEFEYLQKMLAAGKQAKQTEDEYEKVMEITENEPIYQQWLTNVMGVSSTLTARLIHEFGYCEERERVGQIWAYSGLAPGQKRRKGEKLDHNPDAKTLAWTVADCMIKQGERSRYRVQFYEPYKKEQLRRLRTAECRYCGNPPSEFKEAAAGLQTTWTHDREGCDEFHEAGGHGEFGLDAFELGDQSPSNATPPWTCGHADARARRYLMKKFLKHYWYITRDIQGLETPDEYVLVHGDDDGNEHEKRTDTFENPAYAKKVLAAD